MTPALVHHAINSIEIPVTDSGPGYAGIREPGGRRFHFADPAGNELAVWALPSQ